MAPSTRKRTLAPLGFSAGGWPHRGPADEGTGGPRSLAAQDACLNGPISVRDADAIRTDADNLSAAVNSTAAERDLDLWHLIPLLRWL
jgi:hypothetical protein